MRLVFGVLCSALALTIGASDHSPMLAAGRAPAPVLERAQSAEPADLDTYVDRVMKTFEVPGLALAVVKDGKVAVAKGYGVRKLGEAARVDAQTLFGIASNTKVFTAVALGLSGWQAGALSGLRQVNPLLLTAGAMGATLVFAIAISMGMVLALTRKRPEKRTQIGLTRVPPRAVPAE